MTAGNAGTDPLAEAIWNASRADEGTISATGANHVAAAVRTYLTGLLAHVNTVETVARALFAEEQCDREQRKDVTGNWERRLSVEDCNEYRALARAALVAIDGLIEEDDRG